MTRAAGRGEIGGRERPTQRQKADRDRPAVASGGRSGRLGVHREVVASEAAPTLLG